MDQIMGNVKRVLWVDDNDENEAKSLFEVEETKEVKTMDEAIEEIASSRLYEYDTIVFDIDFENGLEDRNKVLEELSKHIYLDTNQKNNDFIKKNGGYLLYLYLLERGYPSDQVAFLTGNGDMLKQLKNYESPNRENMTKEEIVMAYKKAWDEAGEEDDAYDVFRQSIDLLPVDSVYKSSDTIKECSGYLDNNEDSKLHDYIYSLTPPKATGISINNTGDEMIYKFHKANLNPPEFFSKNDSFINGHGKSDAQKWLNDNRNEDALTRWLILSAGKYVKSVYSSYSDDEKNNQAKNFFLCERDPGIESSFSQLYNLLYGLRNVNLEEPYFQAISAMLIPFHEEVKPRKKEWCNNIEYDDIRRTFIKLSKESRNYCMHNYFGLSVNNITALFIIMSTLIGVLEKTKREAFDEWFKSAGKVLTSDLETRVFFYNHIYEKMNNLVGDMIKANDFSDPWCMITKLRDNETMSLQNKVDSSTLEEYHLFSLAAYVVKWFKGSDGKLIGKNYGKGVEITYRAACFIVQKYRKYMTSIIPASSK